VSGSASEIHVPMNRPSGRASFLHDPMLSKNTVTIMKVKALLFILFGHFRIDAEKTTRVALSYNHLPHRFWN
jgi:hypothetical protein